MALVTSTNAHAKILDVDTTEALRMPGVVDYISHSDVPGNNKTGFMAEDEEVFASEEVLIKYIQIKTQHTSK